MFHKVINENIAITTQNKIYYFRASLQQDLPGKTPTDKSNAIKTVINFLSFVKPLKTGTNYNQKHHYKILQGCTH
jgi:hypothetical protein